MSHSFVRNRLVTALLVPILSAVLVVGAVSGCAAAHPSASATTHKAPATHKPHPTKSSTPSATPTAAPTATFPPPLPANALFQISATVTAPGGAAADLVQTVYPPAAATAAQKTQMNTDCAGLSDPDAANAPWLNDYQSADMLTATVTATLKPGSPAWDNTANGVLAFYVGFGDFTGAFLGFEAGCAPGFITIPGTQQQLAPVQSTDPAGQDYGWAGQFGSYGFVGGGNDPGGPDLGGNAVVSNCVVQLSPAAQAAGSTVTAWATHSFTLAEGCVVDGAQS